MNVSVHYVRLNVVDHFSKGKLFIIQLSEVVSGGWLTVGWKLFKLFHFQLSTFLDRRGSLDWPDPRERPGPRVREECRDLADCLDPLETPAREDREV